MSESWELGRDRGQRGGGGGGRQEKGAGDEGKKGAGDEGRVWRNWGNREFRGGVGPEGGGRGGWRGIIRVSTCHGAGNKEVLSQARRHTEAEALLVSCLKVFLVGIIALTAARLLLVRLVIQEEVRAAHAKTHSMKSCWRVATSFLPGLQPSHMCHEYTFM